MPNFSDILDTPSTEVTRPKPMPQGTYLTMVRGLYKPGVSTKKGTEFSEYTLQVVQAMDDVDPDALNAALTKASGEMIPLSERSFRLTMYHTPDALWRLKKFLNDLDIPETDENGEVRTLRERMQDVPNRQVYVHIKHTPSEDGEAMYANVDRTARVEEEPEEQPVRAARRR